MVLISDHTKGIYEDKWVGDIFHYTGMGLRGNQSLDFMANAILANSKSNGVEVHLFEVFEKGRYFYQGRVKLAGEPYQTYQTDIDGNMRIVWVFPLKILDGPPVYVPCEYLQHKEEHRKKQARKLSENELQERAAISSGTPGERQVITKVYERNQYVAEYAKRRAKGRCHEPYLETHHIIWLSRGGKDSIDNTVALCPNCHRKMHIVDDPEDIETLKRCIAEDLSSRCES
ncbi:HNH endonuclease [Thermanaeromonas toyohensis]|uniref:HNH endonuclease n=1 Tax=Thermanaeromonas toyohensis TaxID=161154 RepID=UPI0018D36E2D|nr:HNH endonuclease signature motif containing protein [Thermanaeromonas toyohensis]